MCALMRKMPSAPSRTTIGTAATRVDSHALPRGLYVCDQIIVASSQVATNSASSRRVRHSPTGASGRAVVAPVDTIAIPVGELVDRVAGKRAFERAEADARSWSRTPAPTAAGIVVIERAAILDSFGRWSSSNGGTGGTSGSRLGANLCGVRASREKSGRDRSGRENDLDHRLLLICRLATI